MPKLIRIYPLPDAFIAGVPAVEQDVTPERWAELSAYQPPAFTTHPPPRAAATKPTGPVDQTGPLDSNGDA